MLPKNYDMVWSQLIDVKMWKKYAFYNQWNTAYSFWFVCFKQLAQGSKNVITFRIQHSSFSPYLVYEIPSYSFSRPVRGIQWIQVQVTNKHRSLQSPKEKEKSAPHTTIFNQGVTTESWELLPLPSKQKKIGLTPTPDLARKNILGGTTAYALKNFPDLFSCISN